VLSATYRGLAGRLKRARYLANRSGTRWRDAVEEHGEILAALEARDGDRLARLLGEHLANKRAAVEAALEWTPSSPNHSPSSPRKRGSTGSMDARLRGHDDKRAS
jgi:DNA-binding GntR family transcriptional regulator